jgi:hypothetical protein
MTRTEIHPGDRFRRPLADASVLFEVTSLAGRGVWRCVAVNEPWEHDGKTYPSDHAGEVHAFTTAQIAAALTHARYAAESRAAQEAFYAGLTLGQTVHYFNMRRAVVRCVVARDGDKHVLRPVGLVGDWHYGSDHYYRSKIARGETFTPHHSCIFESPSCAYRGFDPTAVAPVGERA